MSNQAIITKRGDVYDTLEAIDRGGLSKELGAAFRKATLASLNTMKKSKVIVEITIDPDTKTDPLAMRVAGVVKTKLPEAALRASIFYPSPSGELSREHPYQRDIEDKGFSDTPHQNKIAHDPATGEILQEGGGALVE